MNHVVRPYKDEDLSAVLYAWEKASNLAHPFLTREFLKQERFNIPNIYLPNAETWVVEDAGMVVGFIALTGKKVRAIFVQPEFHGQGAGKALMDKARELRGDLEVEVFEANTIGRRFYERYGFQSLAERRHDATGNKLLRLKFTSSKPVSP